MLRVGPVEGDGGVGVTAATAGGGVGSGGRTRPTDSDGEGAGAPADGGGGEVGDGNGATAGGGTGSVRTSTRVEDGAAAPTGLPRREVDELQAPRAKTASSSQARDRELIIALFSQAAPERGRSGSGRRRPDDRGLG